MALDPARRAMRTVRGLDGKTIIGVTPKYIVAGPEMETELEQLLSEIYAANTEDANVFAKKLQLVIEPRITGIGWYLFADPASVPALRYAYLSSAQGVQIQQQESWDTLGMKFRAWLDFGAGWLDWRSAYYNDGSE